MTPSSVLPSLLLYNLQGEKASRIKELCVRMGVVIATVPVSMYLEPIEVLVGGPEVTRLGLECPCCLFEDEMLLFNGFTDQKLTEFLTAYRAEGIEPVFLKATVTPHNRLWNSLQLRDKLKEEYDEFTKNG